MAAVVGPTAHAAAAAADSTPSASSSTTSQPPRRPSNTRFYSATEDVYGDDDDDDATEAAGEGTNDAGSRTPSSTHHLQQPAGLFGPSTQPQLASPHIVLQPESPPTPGSSHSKLPARRPLAAPSFGGSPAAPPKAGFQTSWNRNGSGNERYVSNPSSARGERNFSSAISSHRANLPASRQYFLTVVPPEDFPTDPPHPRSLGASASYNHLRRGALLPLYPTLNGQLYAVAREYGLPSIGGLSIYLCEDADGNLGPRIGESSWQALWQCYFEQEQAPDVGTSAWPSPRSPSFSNWGPDEGWRARSISGRHVPMGLRTPSAYPERERRDVSGSSVQSGKRHSSPSHPLPEEASTSFSGSSRASSFRMAAALPIVGRVEWAVDKHRAAWWSQWIGESVDTAANARPAPSRARSLKLASSSIAAQRTPQGTEPPQSSSLKAENARGGQDVTAARTPNNAGPSQTVASPPRESGSQAVAPRASQQHLASPASVAEDATVRKEDVGRPVSGTYEGYSMLSDGEGIGAGAGDNSQDGKQTSQDSDNDAPSRRPTGLTRKRSRRSAAAPSRHVKQASRDLHRLTFDSGTSNPASQTDGSSHRRHPSSVSLRNEQRTSTNSGRLPRQPEGGTSQHSSFTQMPESDESMWRALKDAPQPPLPLRSEEAAARDNAEQGDGEQRPYGLGNVSDWIEHTQKSPNLLKHRSAFIQKDIDHDRRSEAGESEATGETDESFVPREDDIGEVMQLWAANGSNAPLSRDSMQFPKTASSASFPPSTQAQAQTHDQPEDQPQDQAQPTQPKPTQPHLTQPQRRQSQSLGDHLPVGATRPATLLSPITLDDAAVFAGAAPQLGDLATNAGPAANGQGAVDDAAPSEKEQGQRSVDSQADNVPSGPPSIHSSSTSISGLEDFERALQLLSPVASNSTHSPSLAQLGWSKEGKMSARDSLAAARCLSTSVAPSPRWLRTNGGSSTASGMYSPHEGSFSTQPPRSPVLGMINGIRPMSSPTLSAPDRTPRPGLASGRSSESKLSSPLVTQEVREVETDDDQPGEGEDKQSSVDGVQAPADESQQQQQQASVRGSIVSRAASQAEASQAEAGDSQAETSLRDSTISANQDERQSLCDSTVSGTQDVLQPPSSARGSTVAEDLQGTSTSPRHSVVSGGAGDHSPSARSSAASSSVQGVPPSVRDSRLSDAASAVPPSVRGSIMSSAAPSARNSTGSSLAPDGQVEAPATSVGDSTNGDDQEYAVRSQRSSTATSKHASQPAMSTSASGYTLDAQSEYEDNEASEASEAGEAEDAGEAGEGWTVIPDGQEAAGSSHEDEPFQHDLNADESQIADSDADAGSASQRSSIAWAGEGKYRYPDIRRGSTTSAAESMDNQRQSVASSRDLRNSAISEAEVQEEPEVSADRAFSPASAATALASAEERPSTPRQASQLSSLDTSAAPLMEPQQLTIFDSPTSTTSADALLTDARARHMTGLVTEWPPLEERPECEEEMDAEPTQGDEAVPLSAQSKEDPEHSPSESAYWKHTVSVPTNPRQSLNDSPSASQPLQSGEEQDAQMLSAPQPSFTRRPPLSHSTSEDAAPSITRMIRGLSFSASSDAASEKAASPGPADAPASDSGSTSSPSQLPYEGDREVAESDATDLPDAVDAAQSERGDALSNRDSVTSASVAPTSRANFTHMDLSTKLNEHESDVDGWSQSGSHSSHLFDDDTQRVSTSLSNPSRLGDSGPGTPSFYLERHLNGNSRPTSKLSDLAMGEFRPNGHAVETRMDTVESNVEARNGRVPTRESSEKTASLVDDEGKYGSEADFASERSVQEGEGNDVSDDLDAMLSSINAFNNNSSGSGSGSSRTGHVRDSGSSDVRRVSGATESDPLYAPSSERAWNQRDSLGGDDDDNVALMTQDVRSAVRSALTNSERYSHDDPLPAPASMQSMKSFYSGTGSAGGSPVFGASSPSSPRGVPRRAYSGDPQAWRRPSASSMMSSGSASSSLAHQQQLYGAVPGSATAGGTPGVMPSSTTTSAVLSPRIARFKTLPPSPSLAHLNNEFIQPSSPLQSSFSLHSTPMPEDHTDEL